jgi:hypothetical protein
MMTDGSCEVTILIKLDFFDGERWGFQRGVNDNR